MKNTATPDVGNAELAQIRELEQAIADRLDAARSSRARVDAAEAAAQRLLADATLSTEQAAETLRASILATAQETIDREQQEFRLAMERRAHVAAERHDEAVGVVVARVLPEGTSR